MSIKNIDISILGFELQRKGVPADIETINELAKDAEAAYKMALDHWAYHTDYSKLRPAICAAVEEATGMARESHEEETTRGKRTVFDESEKNYLDRVSTAVEEGEVEGFDGRRLAEVAQAAVDSVPVSFEKAIRGAGSGEPAKKWLSYYDEAVSQDIVEAKIEAINNSSYYTGSELSSEDEDIRVKFALACKEIVTKKTREISVI